VQFTLNSQFSILN